MSLFRSDAPKVEKNSPEYALQKVTIARFSLLLAVAFTVVNAVLACLDTNTYFLFSLSLPYYIFSMYGQGGLVYLLLPLALLVGYVLCWFFSKKKPVFLVVALIAFVMDCIFLAYLSFWIVADGTALYLDFLLDYLCHAWILMDLIISVRYLKRYQAAIADAE